MAALSHVVSSSDLPFPVIIIARPFVVVLVRRLTDFGVTNSLAIKNGFFDGAEYIDSSLRLYSFVRFEQIRPRGLLGYVPFLNHSLDVSLSLKYEREITGQELGEMVRRQMAKDRYFWNAAGTYTTIVTNIKKAVTFDDVVRAISG